VEFLLLRAFYYRAEQKSGDENKMGVDLMRNKKINLYCSLLKRMIGN
jgi:hypothetical protein